MTTILIFGVIISAILGACTGDASMWSTAGILALLAFACAAPLTALMLLVGTGTVMFPVVLVYNLLKKR